MSTQTIAAGGVRERLASLPAAAKLRLALKLDVAVTGANGVAYLALAGVLDSALGIEAAVLRGTGAFLVAFAAAVAVVATRPAISPAAVRTVAPANAIWAADSLVLAIAGWLSPSAVGTVWIVAQALVVAGFAALQLATLRAAQAERS